jgi:hypothetical protein
MYPDPNEDPIEWTLVGTDLTTVLAVLPVSTNSNLYLELNEPGSGNIKIPLLSSAAALVESGQFVRAKYRGELRGGFFVENISRSEVNSGEGGELWTGLSGRGPLSLFDRAKVWTDGSTESTREFTAMTKAGILIALITEAQARGVLTEVTYDFTDTVDTDSAAWTDSETMQFSVGKSYLDVIREMAEMGIDFQMTVVEDGTFNLSAYSTEYGTDKSETVYFRRGSNCVEVSRSELGAEIANAILVKHDGGYTYAGDSTSITNRGRREVILDAHDALNSDNALTYGTAKLEFMKDPKTEHDVKVYDGIGTRVFIDYDLGDYVTLDLSGVETSNRVRSLQLTWDMSEKADVTVGLNSTVLENEIRQSNDIRKLFEMIRRQNDGTEVMLPFWAAIGKLSNLATDGTAIRAVAVSDAGYLYAGGTITKIGNVTVNNIARYNIANGQWSQMGSGVDNDIYAITCSGTKVFIARDAGASEEGVIYWDEDTETYESIGVGLSPAVSGRALCVDGDNLYIGGLFDGAGGVTSENIILYDIATNTFTAMDGLDPDVWVTYIRSIAVIGNKVFCGGDYHEISGDALFVWEWGGVEAWTAIGGWTSAVASGNVDALTAYNGKLIIGGVFEDVQGVANTTGLAVYDPDTGDVSSLGGGMYSEPVPWPSGGGTTTGRTQALLVVGSDLYIAGYYHYIGESQMETNSITKWNGANFENLTTGINSNGYCLTSYDGNIVVGGAFDSAGGKTIKYIGAYITNLENLAQYLETGSGADSGSYTHPNHTGDVTSVGDGATTIANDAVTNAKLDNMVEGTVKARISAGTGDPQDVTLADFATEIQPLVLSGLTGDKVAITDTSGAITTDSNLTYDAANDKLGLGVASPVTSNGGFMQAYEGTSVGHYLTTWGTSVASFIRGVFARGTAASPTAAQADDVEFRVRASAHNGSTYASSNLEVRFLANENQAVGAHGSRIEFYTTPDGSTTLTKVMTLQDDGNINIESGKSYLVDGSPISGGGSSSQSNQRSWFLC